MPPPPPLPHVPLISLSVPSLPQACAGSMAAPSGGAADEAALLHPADFWEPVADRDCRVELVLPPEPALEQQGRVTRKRRRSAKEDEEEPRVVVVEAASQLLKAASQKFRWGGACGVALMSPAASQAER